MSVQNYLNKGYILDVDTDTYTQLRKPKRVQWVFIVLGLLLTPIFGIGLLVILFALLSYAVDKDKIEIISKVDKV